MQELLRFALMLGIGGGYGLIYDIFRIGRRLIKHSVVMVSVEDLIFWTATGLGTFYFFLYYNNGIFRVYMIIGIVAGILLYRLTIGRLIVYVTVKVFRKIGEIVGKVLKKTTNVIRMKREARVRKRNSRGDNIHGASQRKAKRKKVV